MTSGSPSSTSRTRTRTPSRRKVGCPLVLFTKPLADANKLLLHNTTKARIIRVGHLRDVLLLAVPGAAEEDISVDITTVDPIQAFLSSDEDDEDCKALMFLPVSPEIEEPEEGWPAEGVSYSCLVRKSYLQHCLLSLLDEIGSFDIEETRVRML